MDDAKLTHIFLINHYLNGLPTEKVRLVFRFVQAYAHPETYQRYREIMAAQQNPDFVEHEAKGRITPKSVENPPLPDLITDVLDRPRSV